jgi:ribosomal protein S18 acetylase RimI-like enzyme
MPVSKEIEFRIRSFTPKDLAACRLLYTDGLLSGGLAPNDTGWDIDNIEQVYMRTPENHFWVAVTPKGEIVGMLGVQHHETGVGEIRRLRVHRRYRRRGIGGALLETALRFCQQKGDVKVTLDTVMDKSIAMPLFEKFHFRLQNTKQVGEKELLYFYLDLYRGEKKHTDNGK